MAKAFLTVIAVAIPAGSAGAGVVYDKGSYDDNRKGRLAEGSTTTRQADEFGFAAATDVEGATSRGMHNYGIAPHPVGCLSITNTTPCGIPEYWRRAATNASPGPHGTSIDSGADGTSALFEQSFQLNGDRVPEPATLSVFGLGAVDVAGVARRRPKNRGRVDS
jgi:hypothetical protein